MKQHVLFVDDDPSFLDGLRRILHSQRGRWEMTFVTSVEQAVECVDTRTVDTIVSDVMLPGRSGFDLLRAVTASSTSNHVPVIMMTGADQRDLKRRALDEGATDLLSKPIDPDDLTARIRSALRLKAYEDEIRGQSEILECKVMERTEALNASRLDLIWRLGRVAEFRDEQTGNHVVRVGSYCRVMAEALGMGRDFADMICFTSPLHDIGKIGIPDGILLQPRALTPDEWEIMRRHCVIGADILRQDVWRTSRVPVASVVGLPDRNRDRENPFLAMASLIALTHHEWWDGTGYPRRLSGEGIPLESRIVAVADVYDALHSARPYKPAFLECTVLGIMKEKVGSHFDPDVYRVFERSLDAFREIRRRFTDEALAA
ncbi:MAG: response regulator [Nitrospirae bacterium]|nr:response regulator [Nitrospirota bacterium]